MNFRGAALGRMMPRQVEAGTWLGRLADAPLPVLGAWRPLRSRSACPRISRVRWGVLAGAEGWARAISGRLGRVIKGQ